MKIVFVTQPLSTGGAERVVAALANKFYELGHEIKIIIVDNGDKNVYYTHENIEFIHINKPANPVYDLLYRSKQIRKYLNKYKPDVVLPFTTQKNVSVLMATLFSKHPVIVAERNNPYQDPKSKCLRILRKLLYFTSNRFVFQTDEAKAFFSKKIQERSCVISNPVSDSLPEVWHGTREHRIVLVNRLDFQKNIKLAIDAFSIISDKNPGYKMEIYGKGPLEAEIRQYIEKKHLKDKVRLMGFCNDVLNEIKKAEIYLLTSNYEGMSNSLMEALSMGLVCISTDHPTGGARALINNGENGLLISTNSLEECVNALESVINSQDMRNKLSQNAIKIREQLSIDCIANQWINYIKDII